MSSSVAHAALLINAALLDSIWEGALVAGLVWLGLRCLRQLGSASRYTIWLSALVALVAVPLFTALVSEQLGTPTAPSTVTELRQTIRPAGASQFVPAVRSQGQMAAAATALPEHVQTAPRPRQIMISEAFVLALALVWALVAFGRMLRLAMNFQEIAAIRREARIWSEAYDFPVYVSNHVRLPIAIGFLRPAVILPASIFDEVNEHALEAILIHEIAHLRRYDVWTNAFAQVLETFLALNPVSWFVAHQITTEREIACDDWVVAQSASCEAFAQALSAMASGGRARMLIAAPSALGSRRAIVVRIEQLMDDGRPRNLRFSTAALGGAVTLLTLIAFTLQAVSPALAFAPQFALPAQTLALTPASSCAQRDRGPILHHRFGPGGPQMLSESLDSDALQRLLTHHPATTTTYEVSVDASGHPHNLSILHASDSPAQDQRIARSVLSSTFEAAHHNCVAVAAVFRSGLSRLPEPSVVVVTTQMRSENNGEHIRTLSGSCTVPHHNPEIIHMVWPALTDSMKALVTQRTFMNAVKVRINASGTITSAIVTRSSGKTAFDNAALSAARRSTYAPGIVNCKPVPSDYIELVAFTQWLEP